MRGAYRSLRSGTRFYPGRQAEPIGVVFGGGTPGPGGGGGTPPPGQGGGGGGGNGGGGGPGGNPPPGGGGGGGGGGNPGHGGGNPGHGGGPGQGGDPTSAAYLVAQMSTWNYASEQPTWAGETIGPLELPWQPFPYHPYRAFKQWLITANQKAVFAGSTGTDSLPVPNNPFQPAVNLTFDEGIDSYDDETITLRM